MLRRDFGAKLALFRSLLCGLSAVTGDQVSHHRQNVTFVTKIWRCGSNPPLLQFMPPRLPGNRDRALNARRREYPFGSQLLHVGPAGVAISRVGPQASSAVYR